MNKIRVLLADDHAIFREGLRLLLGPASDMDVVGEAANGQSAIHEARRLRPDVILMDLAMPLLNGVDATRIIARDVPSVRVIVLSSYSDATRVRKAVAAGASGYLMKEDAANEVLCAVREVYLGNAAFSPAIARHLAVRRKDGILALPSNEALLTSRQTEVLQLIAEGHSSKQIATLLLLSVKTIEKHRQAMMKQLGIHEIASLTRYAMSNGLLESTVSLAASTLAPTAIEAPGDSR
jgi:DNA-binding NarL/FixJ family response regulator